MTVQRLGGPDVLELTEAPVPEPGPGMVRVAVRAIALNFRDVQQRRPTTGTPCPFIPGSDFAGEVVALGPGVRSLRLGQRVVGVVLSGAYADQLVASADALLPIPDEVGDAEAAVLPVAGLSASFLCTIANLPGGATVVTYAAAGGLGCFLGGCLAAAGIRSIGLTSTPAKAEIADKAGHAEVIVYRDVDPVAAVRELTDGRGVDAVFDSVAGPEFDRSFRMAADGGLVVLCGRAAGEPDLGRLAHDFIGARRNLALREFYLASHLDAHLDELPVRLAELMAGMSSRRFHVPITEFPLDDVRRAHELLESGVTTGKLVLRP
ncbi:quinone oxidoreductase family protein [Nocardia sp. CA-135953]|uniref:quinone oxidoreductase family protein n=1 Tax=Nocardia sp. CA-135953 TaxID=3239978 RepID=UPI003D97A9AB